VLLLCVLLAGCASGPPAPGPRQVAGAQAAWPGTTITDLERGRRTYLSRCSACHRLHAPTEVAASKWPSVVHEMTDRAKLPAPEADDLVRYLVVASSSPGE
jgi:cytochrome c